jgi:hypothetical protein
MNIEQMTDEINQLKQLDNDGLLTVGDMITTCLNIKKDIEWIESALKNKKEELKKLEEDILPSLLLDIGVTVGSDIKTPNGYNVKVVKNFKSSIPAVSSIESARGEEKIALLERRDAALAWLVANNLEGIIKSEINIDVGKDTEYKKEVLGALNKIGVKAQVNDNVHFMTLNATIKELIENGVDVPRETFNVYEGNIVKITKK